MGRRRGVSGSRRRRRAHSVGIALAALGLLAAAGVVPIAPPVASAASPSSSTASAPVSYQVTLAARVCSSYQDVMANGARNDIQESLEDLGKSSAYGSGQAIDPTIEETNDPDCEPLNGVVFSFSSAYAKSGQYTVVTPGDPDARTTSAPTQSSVPLLDAQGQPVGSQTIAGATTYTLNASQVQLAADNALWVQGGTPSDPLPSDAGGAPLGFAALRCSIDNLNGDNVEWIGYPAGVPSATHVFCFAYYIDPPPAQGRITIVKEVAGGSTVTQQVPFLSNATYEPSGIFQLNVNNGQPASQVFYRAVSSAFGGDYTFQEQPGAGLLAQGWTLQSLSCTGEDHYTLDQGTGSVSIDLQDGDDITCTWVDAPPAPPPGDLTIRKETVGGTGSFPITATPAGGTGTTYTATTTGENEAVLAGTLTGVTGSWTISEGPLPSPGGGTWTLSDAYCDGQPVSLNPDGTSITVDLGASSSSDCTLVNTFEPRGSMTLRLVTLGGTGSGGFVVTDTESSDPPDQGLTQQATTTVSGSAATATGDPTDDLALSDYQVTSTPPASTPDGAWSFVSFTCEPSAPSPSQGTVVASLTSAQPDVTCTAVYQLDPPTLLNLVKQVTGTVSARTGSAIVTLECVDDAQGNVVAPPGSNGAFALPSPLQFIVPTTCTLSEVATGAAPGARVQTTATLETDGVTSSISLPATIRIDRSATDYTITVTDSYSGGPALAATGQTVESWPAWLALALIGSGLLLLASRRRVR